MFIMGDFDFDLDIFPYSVAERRDFYGNLDCFVVVVGVIIIVVVTGARAAIVIDIVGTIIIIAIIFCGTRVSRVTRGARARGSVCDGGAICGPSCQ